MKKNIMNTGVLVTMLVAMGSCEDCEYDPPEDQPVYFEYNYINHAWGYQHHGWLIDGDGYVRYFESPDSFRTADSSGYMTPEDLEYNLGQTDSIVDQVDPEELQGYIDCISGAAKGEIGESINIAADAGASVLTCYMYDQVMDAYLKVFLAQSGDWEQFNLSAEAEKLVSWLRGFNVFWLSE